MILFECSSVGVQYCLQFCFKSQVYAFRWFCSNVRVFEYNFHFIFVSNIPSVYIKVILFNRSNVRVKFSMHFPFKYPKCRLLHDSVRTFECSSKIFITFLFEISLMYTFRWFYTNVRVFKYNFHCIFVSNIPSLYF